jgi:hypothetical protein
MGEMESNWISIFYKFLTLSILNFPTLNDVYVITLTLIVLFLGAIIAIVFGVVAILVVACG